MRGLGIAGTAAMFLVGGGILVHGIPVLHHWMEGLVEWVAARSGVGGLLGLAVSVLFDMAVGVAAGGLATLVLAAVTRARRVILNRGALR
jgi:predicted DNA repair protein MutK